MLPAPINWLQKPFVYSRESINQFRSFLQNFVSGPFYHQRKSNFEEDNLKMSITKAQDEYFEMFQKMMLDWSTAFRGNKDDDWKSFAIFQTEVFSEIEQWFRDNNSILKVRFLSDSEQAKEGTEMSEQFYSWVRDVGMGRQPDVTFDGSAAAILLNHFSQTILLFLAIGGELFGIQIPDAVILSSHFKNGVFDKPGTPRGELGSSLPTQQFCHAVMEYFVSATEDNLGFEGLGSLFG
jgi:hypothetical protein